MYTYARFFPPYVSCLICRFSVLVFLSFSFIFSTLSWKRRPALFVLELRHLSLWSSGHSVKKKNCQIVEEVWTMTEQVVKSKDLRRQTKEWMAVFSQSVWECYRKSCKYVRNNSTKLKGLKVQLHIIDQSFEHNGMRISHQKKVGKPRTEKGGAHFMQAWC